jgi:ATP-binding cassette subfamily C (CFTR/MRP) protein 1
VGVLSCFLIHLVCSSWNLTPFSSHSGQRQRVSLARSAYARPDLVLLDDPLSALDAGTGKLVFERLIKSRTAFFKNTAVVLVTHASHFLNRVDKLLVMVEGSNEFYGSWSEMASFNPGDSKAKGAIEFIRGSVQEGSLLEDNEDAANSPGRDTTLEQKEKKGSLITTEQREHGLSSLGTWLLWFKHAGGFFFMTLQVLFMGIDRFAYVAVEYWLARWTSGSDQSIDIFGIDFAPQTDGRSAQYKYLTVYSLIILISVSATLAR